MRSFRRRLELLEKRLIGDPILLEMPNGRTERILGDPSYLLYLMMCRLNGEQVPEMELIAQSIRATEPGGGFLVDVARLLHVATHERMQPTTDELSE